MAFGSMNSGDDAPMSDINVTPLVDVMLVLLIVFMITMPVLTHSIPLELPSASENAAKQKEKQPKDPLRLTIDVNGNYYIDGDSTTKADINTVTSRLKTEKQKNANTIVAISADKAVEYEYVNKALEAAREAGITKIGFVTETKAQ
jgi:biopolymer transport protein exbD